MNKPYKMLMALMNYTESNKKRMETSIQTKLKDKAGIAGSKSTQIRFIEIIISTIHPYACMGCKSNATKSTLTILSHRGCFSHMQVKNTH